MFHERIARNLAPGPRALLLAHIDGSVPIRVAERAAARNSLMAKGLLRSDRPNRPTKTLITDDGRQVLAWVLAECADALTRAGYGVVAPSEAPPLVRDDTDPQKALTLTNR